MRPIIAEVFEPPVYAAVFAATYSSFATLDETLVASPMPAAALGSDPSVCSKISFASFPTPYSRITST